jgi:hypothetical protein
MSLDFFFMVLLLLLTGTIEIIKCSQRKRASSAAARTIFDWKIRVSNPRFLRMEAPIMLVDNIDSLSEFEQDFSKILACSGEEKQMKTVVGIDCEWKPENYYTSAGEKKKKKRGGKRKRLLRFLKRFLGEEKEKPQPAVSKRKRKKKGGSSNPVLLLQISTRDKAWILDMQNLCRQSASGAGTGAFLLGTPLTDTEKVLNRVLGMVLRSEEVLKIGLGPATDLKRLSWSYPFLPALSQYRAVLDLQALAKRAYPDVGGRTMEGLNKLCLLQLNLGVDKSMQCSDWSSRPLSKEQLTYASLDAHVLTVLYESLLATLREGREEQGVRDTMRGSSPTSVVQSLTVGYDIDIDKIAALAAASVEASQKEVVDAPTAAAVPFVALRSTPLTQFPMKKWNPYRQAL